MKVGHAVRLLSSARARGVDGGRGGTTDPREIRVFPHPRRESARERGGSVVRDVQVSPGVVEVTCTYENERELCNAEREVKRASSVDAKNQVCRYVSSL